MAQLKVCPACKNIEMSLTFCFLILLKQEGYILILDDGTETFETFDSNYSASELTPGTPIKCTCGWMGIAKHLLAVKEEHDN